jgi:hypothetical protein
MINDSDMALGEVIDFPVVKAKTPSQLALEKLQAREREKAHSAPITEEVIEVPPDVDKNRLQEIAKDLQTVPKNSVSSPSTSDSSKLAFVMDELHTHGAPEGKLINAKGTRSEISEGLPALVVSVTIMHFVPQRVRAGEQPPQASQKYQILVETSQPLQVGREYQIVL